METTPEPTAAPEPVFKLTRLVATYYQEPDELDSNQSTDQRLTVGFENMYLQGGPEPYVWLKTKRWATTADELAALLADFATRAPELANPPALPVPSHAGREAEAVKPQLMHQIRPRESDPEF
ncbi:hypothetical protein [Hymenobacter nivis]|uniref:Uncharacterized protein n=1 Tax=Hymenobacter nivis TaxID=1850093 RepID=A0A502GW23_9BACT|nr:hypothetical protein [Hymenobacter nivis]TPG66084.1 hypothetical protein EAH73_11995 [Hymenobacter nivis]